MCGFPTGMERSAMPVKPSFGYFPDNGTACLIAVRGWEINPKSGPPPNRRPERVTFALCENFAPYREIRHFPSVRIDEAESYRTQLIREHCDKKYQGRRRWRDRRDKRRNAV